MSHKPVSPRFGIIGMGCNLGSLTSIDELEGAIHAGTVPSPAGAPSAEPPYIREEPRAAAEQALQDAGYTLSGQRQPVAVISVQEQASADIATRWNLTGPTFDTSDTAGALDIAQLLLADGTEDTVLIGDGVTAVVLARTGVRSGRIYAVIDAISILEATDTDFHLAARSARTALADAGTTPEQIGYVELHLSGKRDADGQVLSGLSDVWSPERSGSRRTAISALGSVRDTGGAGFLFSLIKAALCLHHSYVPPWTDGLEDYAVMVEGAAFFALTASRPTVRAGRDEPVHAAIAGTDSGGTHVHVVLSGATVRGEMVEVDWRRAGGPALLPVAGADLHDLMRRITKVRDALHDGTDLSTLSREVGHGFAEAASRVVFCAVGIDAMRTELAAALALLPAAHRANREWVTPAGSSYASSPIGPTGRVALVFPGGMTAYPELAADLHRCFPGLIPIAEAPDGLPHDYFAHAEPLYAGLESAAEETDPLVLESRLHQDFPTALNIGLGFGFLQTRALRRLLGVPVHGAFGYSLGEVSMLYSLSARKQSGLDFPDDEALFRERLGGPKLAARELWGIAGDVPDHAVWTTLLLVADVAAVRAEIVGYDRVFLTHVNTPGEVVVAGDPGQCRALARALGCASLPTSVSYVLHCPVVDTREMAAYIDKRLGAVDDPLDGIELFSAYGYSQVTDFTAAAEKVTDTLRSTMDFPRLVRAMHRRGYRYFIEVGPGATATRWIDEILAAQAHVAASVDRRGAGTAAGIARVLARLTSHGVPVDLSKLSSVQNK
ncbi:hypothetical protein ACIBCN_16305 [Nocardia sp. NPDC051052]|uniref:hypothetical protein n=1 Tax=Nocardia sp. NPDC051052 TaxID=3364322 RepID=UPI0037AD898B